MKKKAIKAKLDKTKKKLVKTKSKLNETLSELESVKKHARKPATAPARTAAVRKPIRKRSPLKKRVAAAKPSDDPLATSVVPVDENVSEPTPEIAATNGQGQV